jgi:hypothetical protein
MKDSLYLPRARFVCYEGEAPPAASPAAPPAPPPAAPPAAPPTADDIKPPAEFTPAQQAKFNEALAADRRRHQAALSASETQIQTLLQSNNLSQQERTKAEEALAQVQMTMRTKEQQAAFEKKQLEEAHGKTLKEVTDKAAHWESRYKESTVARALQDAAVGGDAFQPQQLVTILRPMTKLVDQNGELKAMIEFPDTDPVTKEPVMTLRTPEEAVKRMREIPEVYGNLFKSGVVSGIGANSATGGLTPGKDGKVDLEKLARDPVQFRKVLKENPELLGLRSPMGR